jgi:hypothetical protein
MAAKLRELLRRKDGDSAVECKCQSKIRPLTGLILGHQCIKN